MDRARRYMSCVGEEQHKKSFFFNDTGAHGNYTRGVGGQVRIVYGYTSNSGNVLLDTLLSKGGMSSWPRLLKHTPEPTGKAETSKPVSGWKKKRKLLSPRPLHKKNSVSWAHSLPRPAPPSLLR